MDVTVIGAGTMGHGIAQVTAAAGNSVSLHDVDSEQLSSAMEAIRSNLAGAVERDLITETERVETIDRINPEPDLEVSLADPDLVIEAVPEDLSLKRTVFTDVESEVDTETVIATNTSSLSVTEIANTLDIPDRAIGLHFFNPVHIMELVEVVLAEQTGSETRRKAASFVDNIGKTPIEITDFPGFASSRLGVTLGVEAIRMLEQGVADPEAIDTAMALGYNHPMGPLELTDHVGLDVRLDVLEYLASELGQRFRPPQLLKRKVAAGKLGKKTGEGFYIWENGSIVEPAAQEW